MAEFMLCQLQCFQLSSITVQIPCVASEFNDGRAFFLWCDLFVSKDLLCDMPVFLTMPLQVNANKNEAVSLTMGD